MRYHSWILTFSACLLSFLGGARAIYGQHNATGSTKSPLDTGYIQPAEGDSTPKMQANVEPLPGSAKHCYNSCYVEGSYIAMTFDDGPKPGQTDRLLDMLKARGIKATFFVVGQNVVEYPELIRRMLAEGHEIGNHTWNHQALTKAGTSGVASQINQTDTALVQIGVPKPKIMRPPYGATNAGLNKRLNEEFGQKVILWDVDPLDWKYRNSKRVTSEILKNVKPGSIVLAHDIHSSTVDAMPETLDALQQKGYKFVTVSELISMDRPQLQKQVSGGLSQ